MPVISYLHPRQIIILNDLSVITGYKGINFWIDYAKYKPMTFLLGDWPEELVNISRNYFTNLTGIDAIGITRFFNIIKMIDTDKINLDTLGILFDKVLISDTLSLFDMKLDVLSS